MSWNLFLGVSKYILPVKSYSRAKQEVAPCKNAMVVAKQGYAHCKNLVVGAEYGPCANILQQQILSYCFQSHEVDRKAEVRLRTLTSQG